MILLRPPPPIFTVAEGNFLISQFRIVRFYFYFCHTNFIIEFNGFHICVSCEKIGYHSFKTTLLQSEHKVLLTRNHCFGCKENLYLFCYNLLAVIMCSSLTPLLLRTAKRAVSMEDVQIDNIKVLACLQRSTRNRTAQ